MPKYLNKDGLTTLWAHIINKFNTMVGTTPVAEQIDDKIEGLKGSSNGLAGLDETGRVPSSQLPSYVDDVEEYDSVDSFPDEGTSGKLYLDLSTNLIWRWSGSAYAEISPSLALGETAASAYRGDRGAAAYQHAVTNKGAAFGSGLYKITTNAEGHVTAATAVAKADITGLGIPAQDTTYEEATTSAAGLMSAGDKSKLNSIVLSSLVKSVNGVGPDENGNVSIEVEGGTVSGDYLPLTGGTLTGNLTISNTNNYSYLYLANKDKQNIGGLYASDSENRLYLINHAPNSTTGKYEGYGLPAATDENLTDHKWYKILTSKETVTVAQGGTGATSAADACANLSALYLGAVSTAIEANSDLNNFTTPGCYRCGSGTTAATLANCPYSSNGFRLNVFTATNTSVITQEIHTGGTHRVFHRNGTRLNNVWTFGSWVEMLNSSYVPTSIGASGCGVTVGLFEDHPLVSATLNGKQEWSLQRVAGTYNIKAHFNDASGNWQNSAIFLNSLNYSSHALPLAGGTLTGNLNGTNAYFSGTVEAQILQSKASYPRVNFNYTDGKTIGQLQFSGSNHRAYLISNATDTSFYEQYNFPLPNTGLTENKTYNVLTTKSPVTIAQGGTGATDANTALANLRGRKFYGSVDALGLTAPATLATIYKTLPSHSSVVIQNANYDQIAQADSPTQWGTLIIDKAYTYGHATWVTATSNHVLYDAYFYQSSTTATPTFSGWKKVITETDFTDNKVTQTSTNPTTSTKYYPLAGSSSSTTTAGAVFNTAFNVNFKNGTASAEGDIELVLGNSTATGTAGNKTGWLCLYSPGTSYHMIKPASTNSALTHTLPAVSGTILNTGNYNSYALPLTGGTLTGTANSILALNTTNASNFIYIKSNNTNKASLGYYNNFACIANEATLARIGVNDSGVPQYWSNASSSTAKVLLHTGNYYSYVPNGQNEATYVGMEYTNTYSSSDSTTIRLSLRVNKDTGAISARTDTKAGTLYPEFYTTLNKPTLSNLGDVIVSTSTPSSVTNGKWYLIKQG